MNRASLAVLLALFALGLFQPGAAQATNGTIAVERWTQTGQTVDPVTHLTHVQFRRELFNLGTDGSLTPVANYGIYDFTKHPGQPDDDTYAITQRQQVNGQLIIVDYQLDTDADKAQYVKASAPIMLDSTTDPFRWVAVQAAPSSPTTTLDAAWNLLQAAYASGGNFTQLSQALIGWRAANFAGLSFDDQLQFAQRAFAHSLLGTDLRGIEATLRAAGFPIDLARLVPANGVDLALTSTPTYSFDGSNISVDGINLKNNRATQTGPVKLDLYAFPTPYLGGALGNNARLISTTTLANPLDPGASLASISFGGALATSLPNATYYVTMMVSDGAGRTDHYAFTQTLQIGPINGVPDAERNMPTQLINLSTRLRVEGGQAVAIAGFVVSGTGPKNVIIRALGPSLTPLGVSGALSATSLQLLNSAGMQLEMNTGWTTSPNKQAIINSGLQPGNAMDSAIIRSLLPGAYTAVVRGVGGEIGVGLVEMYDLDRSNANVRPINVSTRGLVLTGDNVLIGGFVIGGPRARRVIVRAIGPSLSSFGITNPLNNPQLALYDASGNELFVNDDWQGSDDAAAISASGRAPTNPRESAIIATLAPGAYTAIVRGVSSATGIALVEAYDLE